MFVKLNLLVICAVTLNVGECYNCEDVFKCVTDWVATALSPNSNITVGIIEDISSNVTTTNDSLSGNFLSDLTSFLEKNFSNLIKESFFENLLNGDENKTKIFVQTFNINETFTEAEPTRTTITIEPDIVQSQDEKHTRNKLDNEELRVQYVPVEEEIVSAFHINKENGSVMEIEMIQTTTGVTETKYNTIEDGDQLLEMTTPYATETNFVTTSNYLNTDYITHTNKAFDVTTENASLVEGPTVHSENTEAFEITNSDTQIYNKTDNISSQVLTQNTTNAFTEKSVIHLDSLIIPNKTIKDNYIDDAYDFFHGNNKIGIEEIVTDNFTDYLDIDYTDFYKDTTNEDTDYTPAVYIPTTTEAAKVILDKKPSDAIDSVYPWIATVFLMNTESKQFEYICDGSLVSERVVLTAARCVIKANATVDAASTLVILGKRSLQATGPNEKVFRVKSIKVHDNFVSTDGKADNDLALVILDEPVSFNADIQPAPLAILDKSDPISTATTGWHVSGPLQPLYLEPQSTDSCLKDTNSINLLCATLGDNETTCSSYGGLLVERRGDNLWQLKGIASGTPMSEGVCFNKDLMFTNTHNYLEWIMKNVQEASK